MISRSSKIEGLFATMHDLTAASGVDVRWCIRAHACTWIAGASCARARAEPTSYGNLDSVLRAKRHRKEGYDSYLESDRTMQDYLRVTDKARRPPHSRAHPVLDNNSDRR